MAYKKIIIALACTGDEGRVVREAIRLSDLFDAELSGIHVADPAAGKAHMMMDSLPLKTEDDFRNEFRKLGFEKQAGEINITTVEGTNYAAKIAEGAKNVDLLVIGHHPKSRLLAALTDSVDERVSDRVTCPMLVVPCGH